MHSFSSLQQLLLKGYGFWCAYLVQSAHDEKTEQPPPQQHDGASEETAKVYSDEQLSDIIDYVLKSMDLNNDGYVDYMEYRKSEMADLSDHEKTKT